MSSHAYDLRRKGEREPYHEPHQGSRGMNEVCMGSDYTPAEMAFLAAVQEAKHLHGPFPAWTELLTVLTRRGWKPPPSMPETIC